LNISEIVAKTTVLKTRLFRVFRGELENHMSTHNARPTYTPSYKVVFTVKNVHPLAAVSMIERTVTSTSNAMVLKPVVAGVKVTSDGVGE
jgi:hypothetical protein